MAARYILSRAVSAAVNGYGGSKRGSSVASETVPHWLPQFRRQLKQNDAVAIRTVRWFAQRGHGCSWMVAPFIGPGPFGRSPRRLHAIAADGLRGHHDVAHSCAACVGGGVTSRTYAGRLPRSFRR